MEPDLRHAAAMMAATFDRATPFVVIDDDRVDANIAAMATRCRAANVSLRPHIKTHKSTEIAERQLAAGAVGLTAATLSEAIGIARAGLSTSMFVAVPQWVDRPKSALLMAASVGHEQLLVATDSIEAARSVLDVPADNVALMVEVDSGLGRTGLAPDPAVALIAQLGGHADGRIAGVFTHGGHGYRPGGGPGAGADEVSALRDVVNRSELRGIDTSGWIVSAGSTPTTPHSMGSPVTEQRPGTYVFGDHQQTCIGSVDTTDVAAMVIATVIHSSDQRVVIDAGAKILTKDRADYLDSYGLVVGHGQATIERVYDNHGVLAWPDTDDRPAVGTRLAIVPNHICPVIHQVDEAMLVTGAIHRPLAIDLRGHLN